MHAHTADATGPFVGTSYTEQRIKFADWVNSGRRPDEHPAIRSAKFSPPDTETLEVVGEVALRPDFEDSSTPIHCNICNTERKFRNGGYCAAYGDGYWYIVGPDCGSDQHRRIFNRGLLNFNAELANDASEERISKFYQHYESWLRLFREAKDAAAQALAVRNQIASVGVLERELASARKSGGKLEVRKLKELDADEFWDEFNSATEIIFGQLSGEGFLIRPFIPTGRVKVARAKLEKISDASYSLDGFLLQFDEARKQHRLKRFESDIRDAEDSLQKLHKAVSESQNFLSHTNIKLIEDWYKVRRKERAKIMDSRPYEDEPEIPNYKIKIENNELVIAHNKVDLVKSSIALIVSFSGEVPYR